MRSTPVARISMSQGAVSSSSVAPSIISGISFSSLVGDMITIVLTYRQ